MAQTDYESITVTNAAIGFTASKQKNADNEVVRSVLATLETAQIRFRLDGTDPTSAEGHLMNPGDVLNIDNREDMRNFKAIRTGSTSGVLKVTYRYS